MEHVELALRRLWIVQLHVVSDPPGRKQTEDRPGLQPLALDDPGQHRLAVVEQVTRLFADQRIIQDRGKLPGNLPGLQERPPVDVACQFADREVVQDLDPQRSGLHRFPANAVQAVPAGLLKRSESLRLAATGMTLAHLRVVFADLLDERLALGG